MAIRSRASDSTANPEGKPSPRNVRKDGWKKLKWGAIISSLGIAFTVAVLASGYQPGKVGFFAIITLTPIGFLLAGVFEITTGIAASEVIEKWEQLPTWLGWTIGVCAFFACIMTIMFIAAVVIFNFL